MRPNWTKNPKISRTKEGLYAHHKYEDHAIMLSHPEYAQKNPYEWQNNCHSIIIDEKEVYMILIKRFKDIYDNNPFIVKNLCRSWNAQFGSWSDENNYELYEEIECL